MAILFMAGGSIAMTAIVFYIVTLLSSQGMLFWIAIGCLILIGLQQTGFVALLAKRSIEVTKESVKIKDDS